MKLSGLRSMLSGDAGAIAPLAALMLAGMIGMAGLVTDVGVWYVQRSNLQQATDAAALGAVNEPGTASTVAGTLLSKNGYAPANLVLAEPGYYCPDAAVSARFSSSPCAIGSQTPAAYTAVRLTTQTTGPAILTRVLGGSGRAIKTTAVAARVDEAGLTVASGLASVNLSLANGVLGSLVGGSGLSLSALQYNGLLSTNVDAKLFFNALAANLNVTAGTYNQLLQTQAKVTDVLQASIDALNQQNQIADVSAAIAGLQAIKAKVTGNGTIALGQLFDLGIWKNQAVGSSATPAALTAGLNAYQLATFVLELGNGAHAAAIPTASLGIPGLVGANIQATAIEPPQSAYFAFGPEGVSVHTAQVRLQLTLQVLGSAIQVPLYVEVAHGDATISDIGCGTDPANDGWVKVNATTGIASVYIGAPANSINNFTNPVTVQAAPLVDLGVLQIGAMAQVTAGSSAATTLTFYQPPITGVPTNLALSTVGYIARAASLNGAAASGGWPAQVVSTNVLGGVGSGLWSSLHSATIYTCVLSICTGALSGIFSAAAQVGLATLQPVLSGIDPLIDGLLEALGVKLGTTEVTVSGLRCGVPVLVG